MKTALVITSISGPNAVMSSYARGSCEHKIDFIVIGDSKSPPEFTLHYCDFWEISRQKKAHYLLARSLPEEHYARKNIGYLIAMERGAEIIIETDDDNFPTDQFWCSRVAVQKAHMLEDMNWLNVYGYFSDKLIWPRGFPLEFIKKPQPQLNDSQVRQAFCPIQQGLADVNPDVDAIYRLTMPLPINFTSGNSIIVGNGSWSPINSQNTTWFKEAFYLLYLPSYCSFRMCDIWRGFIAQRICWANEWGVLFHYPTVLQKRNEHNLIKDFENEIQGYLNNAKITEALSSLDIAPGVKNIPENMKKCYRVFVDYGLIMEKEMTLLDAWIEDVSLVCA